MTTCRRRCWGRRWLRGPIRRNLTTRSIPVKSSRWLSMARSAMPGWPTGAATPIKEKRIGAAIQDALGPYKAHTFPIFEIVKEQREY